MKKKFISLNVKFFIIALVAAVVPSVIVGLAMYQKSISIVEQKQEAAVKNFFENISDTILVNLTYAESTSLNIISDNTVRKALLLKDPGKDVAVKQQNQITSNLFFYTGMTTYTGGIYLAGHNGIAVLLGTVDENLVKDNEQEIKNARGGAVWKWTRKGENVQLSLLREIRDIDRPNVPIGYLEIAVQSDVIADQLESFQNVFPGYISLCDTDGSELISRGEYLEDKNNLKKLFEGKERFGWTSRDGVITYYSKVRGSQWVLVSSMKESDLFAENGPIRLLLLTVIAATVGVCLIVVFIFARLITKPLKELTKQTKEISRDNYDIHLNIVSNDEIGILSDNFNEMAKRLDELVNEVLRDKVLQQEAQFNALQAQINPHFLYNNLDTAYWMSRMEKAEKTGKILLALSALYRSAANTASKIISVEDEAKYAKDYITIQELRLGSQILFSLHVEESVKQLSTLRFILQPLIENSIEHGILPTGDFGRISIRIYQQDGFLYFAVEDSGNGTSAAEIIRILKADHAEGRRGMAIRNIDQRLRIQYGQRYGLIFRQADSGGICTVVRQPAVIYEKKPQDGKADRDVNANS